MKGKRLPRNHTGPKRDAQRVRVAEFRRVALEMRLAGATQHAIAKAMGKPRSSVQRWIEDAIAEIPREPAERLRALQLERTERLLLHADKRVTSGDPSAIRAAVRILDHQAKLAGLYAPTKVTFPYGGPLSVKISGIEVTTLSDEQLAELAAGRWPKGLGPPAASGLAGGGGGAGAQAPASVADEIGLAADAGRKT